MEDSLVWKWKLEVQARGFTGNDIKAFSGPGRAGQGTANTQMSLIGCVPTRVIFLSSQTAVGELGEGGEARIGRHVLGHAPLTLHAPEGCEVEI